MIFSLETEQERFVLSMGRIREIPGENLCEKPYRDFFTDMAFFLLKQGKSPSIRTYNFEKFGIYGDAFRLLVLSGQGFPLFRDGYILETVLFLEDFLQVYGLFCQDRQPFLRSVRNIFFYSVFDNAEILFQRFLERKERENPADFPGSVSAAAAGLRLPPGRERDLLLSGNFSGEERRQIRQLSEAYDFFWDGRIASRILEVIQEDKEKDNAGKGTD